MEEITLTNPIYINNEEVHTLTYDASKIPVHLYTKAHALASKTQQAEGTISFLDEIDGTNQLYLGMAAIIAVNPQIDFMDLDRLTGVDIIKVARVGRDFANGSGASDQGSSDAQSVNTAEPTSPQPATSSDSPSKSSSSTTQKQ